MTAEWAAREETWSLGPLSGRRVIAYTLRTDGRTVGAAKEVEILDELLLPDGTLIAERPTSLWEEERKLSVGAGEVLGTLFHSEEEVRLDSLSPDGKTHFVQRFLADGTTTLLVQEENSSSIFIVHGPDGALSCDQGCVTFAEGVYTVNAALGVRPLVDPRLVRPTSA